MSNAAAASARRPMSKETEEELRTMIVSVKATLAEADRSIEETHKRKKYLESMIGEGPPNNPATKPYLARIRAEIKDADEKINLLTKEKKERGEYILNTITSMLEDGENFKAQEGVLDEQVKALKDFDRRAIRAVLALAAVLIAFVTNLLMSKLAQRTSTL